MSHLKHSPSTGRLLHGPGGNLVRDCGSSDGGACPCGSLPECGNCPDQTPGQFHVTFTGTTVCNTCIACDALGVSVKVEDGATFGGTFTLAHNGACAWTADASDVGISGAVYLSTDCSGSSTPIAFAILLARINATQFQLLVSDDTGSILLFSAIITAASCCSSFTASNSLTACGCGGDGESIDVGSGGSAVVTRC